MSLLAGCSGGLFNRDNLIPDIDLSRVPKQSEPKIENTGDEIETELGDY
jgi:hypothetical protein